MTCKLPRGQQKIFSFRCVFLLRVIAPGSPELRIQMTLYYCREDNTGLCRIKTLVFRVPVEVTDAPDAPREISVLGRLDAK